jgi:glutamate dehydrogenase
MRVDTRDWTKFTDDHEIPEWISKAYSESYQGPHEDEADTGAERAAAPSVTPALLGAHYRLGSHRPAGESRVAVYPPDDAGGFGPALQVVTDDGAMLMDSVTVLLHRLGVAYAAIMNPVFHVHRDGAGDLLAVGPHDAGGDGIDETWIHVQLAPSVDPNALTDAERLLPGVLADLRRVAADATSMLAVLEDLAGDVETNANGHYPGADNGDVATLLRWLAAGNFTLLGYQRCPVRDGRVSGDAATASLGVLRRRKGSGPRRTLDD